MRRFIFCLLLLVVVWHPSSTLGDEILYVQQDNTAIYKQDTTLSDKVVDLRSGEKLTVVARWGAWTRVRIPGSTATGWVMTSRLGKTVPLPGATGESGTPSTGADDKSGRDKESEIATNVYSIEIYGPISYKLLMNCKILPLSGKVWSEKYVDYFPMTYSFRARGINCFIRRSDPAGSAHRMRVRFYIDGEEIKTFRGRRGSIGFRLKFGELVAQ